MSLYTYAALTPEQVEKVQALEADTGKRILILREYRPEYAELSDDEFRRMMELEREMGVVAVAIQ
jgi:PHD/YefM family antitoxin component YafN of YafNO toxin-antitoxin module